MNSMIQELWHGNIIPQEDSRTHKGRYRQVRKGVCRVQGKIRLLILKKHIELE